MKTFIVDSFTDQPFKGNPAGVCLPDDELDEPTMLLIAQELGLSETAFIQPRHVGHSIRYFSPRMEIPLCGHATLAAARVLFDQSQVDELNFTTAENLTLTTSRVEDTISMRFPRYSTTRGEVPGAMLTALGLNEIVNSAFNVETRILLLEAPSSSTIRNLKPDFRLLVESHEDINGVLVTAPSDDAAFDFESRYFWPWSGTDEDPVTGGTHTFLAPYWAQRFGKKRLRSFQCSPRTGSMEVIVDTHHVQIIGQAVVVFEGCLLLP